MKRRWYQVTVAISSESFVKALHNAEDMVEEACWKRDGNSSIDDRATIRLDGISRTDEEDNR